jgi:O-antigen ligase
VVAMGLLCVFFQRDARRALAPPPLMWSLVACFGGLLLSSIPVDLWFPAAVDLTLFSKPFWLFLIGTTIAVTTESLEAARRWILPVMLATVVFGVVFLLAPQLQDAYIGAVRAPDERLGLLSAQGFFIGPGTYSWFAVATFALAYVGYLQSRRRTDLVAAIVAAAFVVLSWRRKSILAVVAMVLVTLLVRGTRGSRGRAFAVLALAAILTTTVFAPYATALWSSTLTEYGSSDPYGTARSALYYTSTLIARDHFPLGTGLASFASHASKLYYSRVYQEYGLATMYGLSEHDPEYITDTYWPMVLGEGGIVCLLGYLAFLILLARVAWKLARSQEALPGGATIPMLALMLLVGSFIESMASHIYGSSLQASLVMVPLGMMWRIAIDRESGARGGENP